MKKLFLLLTLMTLSLAAQTTSTALKSQIDTQIINKTGPGSISKGNVGNNIKAVVDYVDQEVSSIVPTPDATNSVKGKVQLAGDLGGTASEPTVPGLSTKVNLTSNQAIDGIKTFLQQPQVPSPDTDGDATNKLYVDGLQKIKVVKTTITQAQILQLFTTPISILNSTTAGIAKIPLNIVCQRSGAGTNYTFSANQFSLVSDSGVTFSLVLSNSILTNTFPVSYTNFSFNANTQIAVGLDNEVYKLGAYTSNPTGGTGNMDVYVTYIEITL
jgi:hypothetical protein